MKQTFLPRRTLMLGALALRLLAAPAQAQTPAPVSALVYSTLPSTAAHRPEMAMDGDGASYFKSASGMGDGDEFLVLMSRPVPAQTLRVVTGDSDGQDVLTNGTVETSPDGVHYALAARFNSAGIASTEGKRRPVEAVRIRLGQGQSLPSLLVREISLGTAVKVAPVQMGPGRGFVDISQAPDLGVWSRMAERQMEESWADTAAMLYSDKFISPNMVRVVYRTGPTVTAVAATGGGVMTVNSQWCRSHPDDTGLTVHETAHVIQAYSAYDPVWLVEGIADYIRWVRFEPEHFHPHINTQKATYHDSYQTTATFLAWCEMHYDSRLVSKLSEAVRFGTYTPALFQKSCGKDVDSLWSEFLAAYKADPVIIITPPVAAADRPRLLPTVTAGTSVPLDLSSLFDTVALTADGIAFSPTGGADGEGTAYSFALLGSALTYKNVRFTLGLPGVPNAVSCRGSIIALPAGKFASLWLLGTSLEGPRKGQSLTVTYADGTTDTFAQSFSDWFQPQSFPGESRAAKMPYRNTADGSRDPRTFYAYAYGFRLNPGKAVKSFALASGASVKVLAVTLAN